MVSLKEQLKRLPSKPGVYLFKDKKGVILYVGKAKSLLKRVSSYFHKPPDIKTGILLSRLYDIDYIIAGSEMDALILEDELIKKYKPRYNIALRDDKSYPLLKLTVNEKWPRLFLVRKKSNDGALYFGRFQGKMVREVIRLVKKLFPIRWCKESPLRMRGQPCLYYRIGSCSGPCIGEINRERYMSLTKGVSLLLEGKMEKAMGTLKKEMEKASQGQDFERAARLRDQAKILHKMMEGKGPARAPSPRLFFGVSELKKAIGLQRRPMRIEAFDVSNTQGSAIVGAMVTFYGGLPLKSDYRKFKIKNVQKKANDVAAMQEMVQRRYTGKLAGMPLPDLIVIDGGLPQVNAGYKALAASNQGEIPIIGLAKKDELIYFPGSNKPLALEKNSPALYLLQRVRDEAHRFAIAYHRGRRSRNLFEY